MALVRCTCLTAVESADSRAAWALQTVVLDPHCGYVLHRLAAELGDPSAATA